MKIPKWKQKLNNLRRRLRPGKVVWFIEYSYGANPKLRRRTLSKSDPGVCVTGGFRWSSVSFRTSNGWVNFNDPLKRLFTNKKDANKSYAIALCSSIKATQSAIEKLDLIRDNTVARRVKMQRELKRLTK